MDTKEMIAVMQAFLNGEVIQCQRTGASERDWFNYSNSDKPSWNWSEFKYRVKPKTRYLNVYYGMSLNPTWSSIRPCDNICANHIGYLEDKQDGSVPVFHPL